MNVDALAEACAAAAGGIFSCSALYPIEIVKNRVQLAPAGSKRSFLATAREILAEEGTAGFLDGVAISSCGSATEKFLYFYFYTMLSQAAVRLQGGAPLGVMGDLAVGYVSEWCHLPVSMPMDTIGVRVQANKDPALGTLAIARSVLAEKGLRGMYSGIGAYVALCFKPALQYVVFERAKAWLLGQGGSDAAVAAAAVAAAPVRGLTAWEAFWLGAVARAVATVATFPYLRAKKIKQAAAKQAKGQLEGGGGGGGSSSGSSSPPPSSRVKALTPRRRSSLLGKVSHQDDEPRTASQQDLEGFALLAASQDDAAQRAPVAPAPPARRTKRSDSISITAVMQKTMTEEGAAGLYKGIAPELARGVLSAALMLMVKERIYSTAKGAVLAVLGGGGAAKLPTAAK